VHTEIALGEPLHLPLQFVGQKTRLEAIVSGWLSEVVGAGSINRFPLAYLQVNSTLETCIK
ncbi:hypothetical protein, partial [Pedobacter agri]|uniref:hypothetical protein n=1 Tax=Pedobacter agri TaxID=454586 RepID=UPI00029AD594